VGRLAAAPDPLKDFDWPAHWRRLVEGREAQFGGGSPAFWDRVAPNFPQALGPDDPLLTTLEPYLAPELTLLDVGAGTGRYATLLCGRLDWVTAVEPSVEMRARMPPAPNLTVVASTWEDADVAPADLVICAHVLYSVKEVVPFLEKLDASARRRVFVYLRDAAAAHPSTRLWEVLTGLTRSREPYLYDAYNVLHRIGIQPDLAMCRRPLELSYTSFEAALDDIRFRVGEPWRDTEGRDWLAEHLRVEADGTAAYRGAEMTVGVLHWRPSR
jgi:SAM-dependent methyltransferase